MLLECSNHITVSPLLMQGQQCFAFFGSDFRYNHSLKWLSGYHFGCQPVSYIADNVAACKEELALFVRAWDYPQWSITLRFLYFFYSHCVQEIRSARQTA